MGKLGFDKYGKSRHNMGMKLPLSWLKEFVDVRVSSEKLAELLTLSGSEVEKIHHPLKLEKVIVGEIVAIEKHPNADRLKVAVVRTDQGSPSTSSGRQLRIVCGAPNIKVGQRVPVALPGAVLASGTKIAQREVRGEVSHGMLCGESELGIGSNATDITILPADAPLGAPVASVLGLDDTVFDLDITPNRGDCFSIRGLAREVAALTRQKIQIPKSQFQIKSQVSSPKAGTILNVRVEDKKACPLYFARLIEGVKIGSSPLVMQQRLAAAGLRPINAAVDIANYVMMELGQPMHAFDAERLISGSASTSLSTSSREIKLVVRRAKRGESLELLDGKTYELAPEDLVIAAGDRADDLAGVMGGQRSGTTKDTTALVLEAAIFDPVQIRRTYKRLGLRTEAAIRFEKKVDPAAVEEALNRATALLLEHCGGTVKQTVQVGALPKAPRPILASAERIAATIGAKVSAAKQQQFLRALGFSVKIQDTRYKIQAPSWRHDIEGEHDIVKEIGRILPLNALAPTHLLAGAAVPPTSPGHMAVRRMRTSFLEYGFDEVLLYSFYGALAVERMGLKLADHLRLANPLSPQQEYLRASLLPNLLESVAKNAALGIEPNLFEIGKVFMKAGDPSTRLRMTSGLSGVREELRVAAATRDTPEGVRALKGALASSGIDTSLAVLSKAQAAVWKIRTGLVVVEAVIRPKTGSRTHQTFQSLPAFPDVRRDLSLMVPTHVSYEQIASQFSTASGLALSWELFEVFEGKPLAPGTKSFGFHLTYRALDRTLTAEEVDRAHRALVGKLTAAVGATLRV